MKKMGNVMIGLLVFCCGLFGWYYFSTRGLADRVPPVLTVPEEPLELTVPAERQQLLAGVSAADETDGDVTELVVLESVSAIYDGNRATASFAAFDRSGNVAKGQRTVVYTNYESPRFTLKEPLIFREGFRFDIFAPLGAEDALDGSLDSRIKGTLVSGESAIDKAGLYEVEFRVTNSLGDTVHLLAPVEVVPDSMRTRIELRDYLIYLEPGAAFEPMDWVEPGSRAYVGRIDNPVDTGEPGVYAVTYYDEKEETRMKTRLLAVVEERP